MTMPHQCRCAVCGAVGVIVSGLPRYQDPVAYAEDVEKATAEAAKPATCTHGYTVCRPCKFPPDPVAPPDLGMRGAWAPDRKGEVVPPGTGPV